MNRSSNGLNGQNPRSRLKLIWLLLRSGGASLMTHWALAGFSLVAAFGIWFVIQDVENPRLQALVPPDPEPPSIEVKVFNNSDLTIPDEPKPVQVKVEGRKGDITGLRPDDFEAQINVRGIPPGETVTLPVKITKHPSGVRVVEVIPSSVTVTIHQAETKEFPVSVRRTASLPAGYRETDVSTDPVSVTVRGIPELISSIASVDLDANLAGARGDTTIEGDLVAHTAGGNAVTVSSLTPARAKANFKIEQVFVSRTLGFSSPVTGTPATGYSVVSITYDPPLVTVTGPKDAVNGLQSLSLEQISVGGAKDKQQLTRQVDKIQNVLIDRQTVLVTVDIKPIDSSAEFEVAPDLKPPAGFVLESNSSYSVRVRVTGPIAQVSTLKPADIRATVNYVAPVAGPKAYEVKVTLPPGLTAEPVDPLTVNLKAAS